MDANDITCKRNKELISGTSHLPPVPFKFQNGVRATLQVVTTEYAIYKGRYGLCHSCEDIKITGEENLSQTLVPSHKKVMPPFLCRYETKIDKATNRVIPVRVQLQINFTQQN